MFHGRTKTERPAAEALPDVVSLFEDIVRELPPGCASLNKKVQPDSEVYVEVVPANPEAAPIAARGGGEFQYDLCVGQGTVYEVISRRTAASAVEEVRSICSAVFAGKFEETVWTAGKKLAKTVGIIQLGNQKGNAVHIHGFYPLRKKKETHFRYAPYCTKL